MIGSRCGPFGAFKIRLFVKLARSSPFVPRVHSYLKILVSQKVAQYVGISALI